MSDGGSVTRRLVVRGRPSGKRPGVSLARVLRSYRLIRYVRPYRRLLVLMFAIIIVYAACHAGEIVVTRDLLRDTLWIPPEPAPTMTIGDVINRELPTAVRPEARRVVAETLPDVLKAGLTSNQRKQIEASALERAQERIRRGAEADVAFGKVMGELLSPLDERVVPGMSRRLYGAMSERVLAALEPKMTERERDRFGAASRAAFAPPPGFQLNIRRIGRLCLALVGIGLVLAISGFYRAVVKARIISRATFDIRNDLCGHLLRLDMKFFGNRSSGDVISRQTNDIVAGTRALMTLFDELAVQPFLVLAYAAAAFVLSWQLAAALMVMLLFLPLFLVPIARRVKKYGRQKLERIAALTTIMSEIFHGTRVTKAFRIEERKYQEFREANRRYVTRLFKTMKLRGLNAAVAGAFLSVAVALVMFTAAFLVTRGLFGLRLEPPDVLMFGGSMMMLTRSVKEFSKSYPDFLESVVASERIFQVLEIEPEVREAADAVVLPPMARSLAFREVSFAYDGPMVLDRVSFEVRRGEMVAVLGHSGAGKSTLLDLIPRFYDPVSGRVEIDGVDVRRATLGSLRGQVAVVSQDPFLFQATILDNIRYGRLEATDEEVFAAARAANISEFIESLPEGYGTVCGERGAKLSGGQRQRITIARAILKDAPILILDEATSSLDSESERLVQEALDRLMERRTTFVIAHRLSTVQHADRIVVLRDGRLVETGTHGELMAKRGEYWRLYETQFAATAAGAAEV